MRAEKKGWALGGGAIVLAMVSRATAAGMPEPVTIPAVPASPSLAAAPASATPPNRGLVAYADVELIDIPTGYVPANRSIDFNFRMYEHASVMGRVVIGLFDHLALGLSWEVQNVIGSDIVRANTLPQPYAKVNVWNESERAPAIALGYNSQGYGPHGAPAVGDDPKSQFAGNDLYFSKPRGFYLVASKETATGVIVQWTAGLNVSRLQQPFDFNRDFGSFVGAAAGLTPDLYLALEYDDTLNPRGGNLNFGINYHMGSGWRIEADAKNIGKPHSGDLRTPPAGDVPLSRMVKLDVLTGF